MGERLLPDDPIVELDDYLATGGGSGLAWAREQPPEDVIERIGASGLRGRGGAGFPTAQKWRGVLESAAGDDVPIFVVCNAAEGEPGTYKDRMILEQNPFAVLEGLLIAQHAVGAERCYVAIKEKFARPLERLSEALRQMQKAGLNGAENIEIVPGPDEYLFGEEKAMLEVIEGKLPMPRIMPPYQFGLFATTTRPNPTVVNNVETFAHVAMIAANGPDWFREQGTDESPGTMPFTVIGDVGSPGVYELPLGTPLRTLVSDIAEASDVKAVFSGTSNTVITLAELDTPLTFDDMSDAGTGLGSGGFVVYDADRCIVKVLRTLARFLAIESCGQCLACKLGTGEIFELLDRVEEGNGDEDDLDAIAARVQMVTDQNRCYLPVGAQLMVGSSLERFADEFRAHLGTRCADEREVPTPLIEDIDPDTGEVSFHPRYHLKQPDWSYSDLPEGPRLPTVGPS